MVKFSLGICVGASSISFVKARLDGEQIVISHLRSVNHEGNPRKVLANFFDETDLANISVAATGRKFKNLINCRIVSEPEAIEESIDHLKLNGKFGAIASLGGENFIVYCLNEKGGIDKVLTGNKCASGTG